MKAIVSRRLKDESWPEVGSSDRFVAVGAERGIRKRAKDFAMGGDYRIEWFNENIYGEPNRVEIVKGEDPHSHEHNAQSNSERT